jgi:trehalose 6-phosphate synthase/phosphatase
VITHLKENHDFVGRGQTPSPAILHCLRALTSDPANDVTVLSGRGSSDMTAILGGIDRLGLAAELGYLRRAAGSGAWQRHAPAPDSDTWRREAKAVMHWFTTRTNGSYSRWQQSAAVWCYHDADPDFGRYQGKQLHMALVQVRASAAACCCCCCCGLVLLAVVLLCC